MSGETWIDAFSRALARRASRKDMLKLLALAAAGQFVADPPSVEAAKQCGGKKTACVLPNGRTKCVNLQSNEKHCGSCGNDCGGGFARCCDGVCIDTGADQQNCGRCNKICDEDQACTNGDCKKRCPAGETRCGKQCVNLQTDTKNCGACDKVCPDVNERCEAGICRCIGPTCTREGQAGPVCCKFAGGTCCPPSRNACCETGWHCEVDGCCQDGYFSCGDRSGCCAVGTTCTGDGRCRTRGPGVRAGTTAAAELR